MLYQYLILGLGLVLDLSIWIGILRLGGRGVGGLCLGLNLALGLGAIDEANAKNCCTSI